MKSTGAGFTRDAVNTVGKSRGHCGVPFGTLTQPISNLKRGQFICLTHLRHFKVLMTTRRTGVK